MNLLRSTLLYTRQRISGQSEHQRKGKSRVRSWLTKMVPRDPHEAHRVSTPLELFFDLVFVVAINFAAGAFHHDLAENHIRHGLTSFSMIIFAITWAWINFTWFSSAYDNDDALYRLAVFVQMTGALVLAAGVERAFSERDIRIVVVGYVIMRLALVAQWIRAGHADPTHRTQAYRYAIGITVVQIAWIWLGFWANSVTLWMFATLVVCEMLVPVIAERGNMTTWHPEHIGERYGLFTIIVLGEAVLASALAIQTRGRRPPLRPPDVCHHRWQHCDALHDVVALF